MTEQRLFKIDQQNLFGISACLKQIFNQQRKYRGLAATPDTGKYDGKRFIYVGYDLGEQFPLV